MIPLKDYNPTTRRAVVTIALIAVNVAVYFLVQPHPNRTVDPRGIREAQFTLEHAAIPCEIVHHRPLNQSDVTFGCDTDPEDLRKKWSDFEQRSAVIEKLEERGLDFHELAASAGKPDADPFDLLCHLAYDAPLLKIAFR